MIAQICKEVSNAYEKAKAHGVNLKEFHLLVGIADGKTRLIGELAPIMGLSVSTSRNNNTPLNFLLDNGFMVRGNTARKNIGGRRKFIYMISEKGLEFVEACFNIREGSK